MKPLMTLLLLQSINLCIGQPLQLEQSDALQIFKFRNVGPTRGGRVTAVAGVASEPGTFYMGATGGGVWKTTDYGTSWSNVSDGYFATPSIGDINVATSDNKIIYVGTGSDGLRSNIIAGKGVYKSQDAGLTWEHVGLEAVGQIGAVEVHPHDPDIAFVAAIGQPFQPNGERGVYRTIDGGANWQRVLYHSDTVGAVDLEFAPDNPRLIYAAMWRAERKPWTIISGGHQAGGIYRSSDGGDTWIKLEAGLPTGLIGKIDLAVSPDDPEVIYALIEAPEGEGGVYVSHDRGESFTYVPNDNFRDLLDRPFYYCNIEANPGNASSIYVMAEGFLKSTNGGKTWSKISTPHGDHHDMWINPRDTLLFIESNDGGANITVNGGNTWSTQLNQPTAELYQVNIDDQHPYWLYAGQQDNTSIAVPSLPPHDDAAGATGHWLDVGGCETGPSIAKPGDHNTVYSSCKGRFSVFNKVTGQEKHYYVGASNMYGHNPRDLKYRFQRVAPVLISPHNPDVIYHASQYLHKTVDEGISWKTISPDLTAFDPKAQVISGSPITRDITGEEFYSTIYSVDESLLKEGLIWVGANDGPVNVTLNGGNNWRNVTPAALAAGGRVNCVHASRHSVARAYICVLRHQLGDWKPYIYRTEDLGSSWTLLTSGKNGIPENFPVRVVREDPIREGILYAGTEYGLFISFDNGKNWKSLQQNLPVTPITDIKIHENDLIVSTMGRSFWIMDNIYTLSQMDKLNDGQSVLFKPRDTYSYRYKGTEKSVTPYYPAPAVIIDYYIHENPATHVAIEIYDQEGNLVRAFHNKRDTSIVPETTKHAVHSFATLETSRGLHRFRWDMRHFGPWDKLENKRFQNGPRVAPGTYMVRLTDGRRAFEEQLIIMKDPRVTDISTNVLKQQEKLALQVRDAIDVAKRLAARIQERMNDPTRDSNQVMEMDSIKTALVTRDGAYMTPMLTDQLVYLASMLDRADQKPGKDAYERFEDLSARLRDLTAAFNELDAAGEVNPHSGSGVHPFIQN